jgi:CheY-like chemotaxis protein
MKILIAEDDEISDSLISSMVDKYSYEILHAKTGDEAVYVCRNNPDVDLVLMDINLTGMDGFEATRQIRQFNKDVVIIAQTAFGLIFDRGMAIVAGCNDYINKPISISEFKRLIRKYFIV